jgi:hypothetical protein
MFNLEKLVNLGEVYDHDFIVVDCANVKRATWDIYYLCKKASCFLLRWFIWESMLCFL